MTWICLQVLALITALVPIASATFVSATGNCETSLLQTVRSPQRSKSTRSCLSFIHIPKTAGGSIEAARIKAASAQWNPGFLSPDAPQGCFDQVRERRRSLSDPSDDHINGTRFRFWGACDDHIKCSTDPDPLNSTDCHFETGALGPGRSGGCPRWHMPPGLDFTLAASYTNGCDTFCVVRDPMQRLQSRFHYLVNETRCNPGYFEEWAHRMLTKDILPIQLDCHFVPQVYYVFENGDYKNGKQICRHVIKYDNLQTEFPALMKQYNLNVELDDRQYHRGKHCCFELTSSTVELVKNFYAADYGAFGFGESTELTESLRDERISARLNG